MYIEYMYMYLYLYTLISPSMKQALRVTQWDAAESIFFRPTFHLSPENCSSGIPCGIHDPRVGTI
jgi:hypothetical protein